MAPTTLRPLAGEMAALLGAARRLFDPATPLSVRSRPKAQPKPSETSAVGSVTAMSQHQAEQARVSDLRRFADENEWVRAAINKIKGRVARSEWVVVPLDTAKPYDAALQRELHDLFDAPNPKDRNWRAFIEPPVEDLCVLGKGGWEYVSNYLGVPLAMLPVDAGAIKVLSGWDGFSPNTPRYVYYRSNADKVPLYDADLSLMLLNPATHRAEGLSPLVTLYDSVQADAAGNEFVRSLLKKYPPPGWLHLGKAAGQKAVDRVTQQIQSDIAGNGGLLITGGLDAPTYTSMWGGTSKDNELQAWSLYFARKIAAVYGISPHDLGILDDANRSNSATQQDLSYEDGYQTVLFLVEMMINCEAVAKYGPRRMVNLAFRFKELSARARLQQAEIASRMLGGIPVSMMNEGRALADLPPLELGNVIYAPTPNGPVPLIGPDADAYRTKMTAYAREQAEIAAVAKGQPTGPNGAEAGGGGGKQAASDSAKASNVTSGATPSILPPV